MGYFDSKGRYCPRTLIGAREYAIPKIRWFIVLTGVPVFLAALLTVLPYIWMILASIRSGNEIFEFPVSWIPKEVDFQSYMEALQRIPFIRYLGNTLINCMGVVSLQLIFSTLAAYSISKLQPRYGRLMLLFFIATMMVPFESMVLPLYLQMRSFPFGSGGVNFLNTYWVLILPATVSAFNIFVLKGFFDRIPQEILFNARLDGCSEWRIFRTFVLPLSRPILVILGVFGFIVTWNSFFWPLVALNDPEMYTLMLGIQKLMENGEPWNIIMAAVTLTTLPSVILFLAVQRWIIRGMAFRGLQG